MKQKHKILVAFLILKTQSFLYSEYLCNSFDQEEISIYNQAQHENIDDPVIIVYSSIHC